MRIPALLAALALIGACGVQPEPDNRPAIEAVQPGHFASQQLFELKQVEPGSSYLKRLLEDIPLDEIRDISVETESWKANGQPLRSDVFLSAPDPQTLEQFMRSDVRIDVPPHRQLAIGQLDDGRWRTYLLADQGAIDGRSIATATLHRDDTGHVKGELVFTETGRAAFHDLTARAVGGKIALLVGHDVAWAPVVQSVIDGGRAEISFGGS